MPLGGRKARVLIVDDDAGSRMLLDAVLQGPNREIVEADDGLRALELLNEPANAFNCAVVLLDIHMPGIDGLETAERMKKNEATAQIPIIFLTGTAGSSQQFKGYQLGAFDYMMKPFDQDVLRSKVDVFIDLWEKNQELQELTEERRLREVEQLKREGEARYQTLANAMPQMAWTADALGNVLYFNDRWTEYTGFGLAESSGRGWLEAIHPDDREQSLRLWQESVERGRVYQNEMRVCRGRDRSQRWHLGRALPTKDDRGQVIGGVGTLTDIEDQKAVEAELSAQYAVARALVESDSVADAMSRVLAALVDSLGWRLAAWWQLEGGRPYSQGHWHEPLLAEEKALSLLRLPEGTESSLITEVFAAGELRWAKDILSEPQFIRGQDVSGDVSERIGADDVRGWVAFPVKSGSEVFAVIEMFKGDSRPPDRGLLETLSAIGSQVAQFLERLDIEQELRNSEELKGSILSSALDAIITMGADGLISEFNPAAEHIFGYQRAEVIGQSLAELLIPPEYRDAHKRGLKRYLEVGEANVLNRRLELPALKKDGSRFDAELAITRVDMPGPPLFTGYLRDITLSKQAERRILDAEERYRTLVEQLPLATYVVDSGGRITYISPQIETMASVNPQQAVDDGGFWSERLHPEDRERVINAWQEWQAEIPEAPFRAEYRLRRPGGRYLWVADAAVPVRDQAGELVNFQGYIVDIDERKRAEQELALLAQAGEQLARSLEYETTLDSVAHLLVPDFADWCVVYLVGDTGRVEPIVVAHDSEEKEEWVREFSRRYPVERGGSGVAEVIESGRAQLTPEISAEMIVAAGAGDPERLRAIEEIGMSSYMCVPMTAHGRVIGAIALIISDSPRRYDESDLEVAAELARRAGLAIDNARLYRERNEVAKTLERSLLPPSLPRVPGVEVAARYHPAADRSPIGGDFYDLFQLDDGEWLAVIGDVVGKGAEAAALTGLARHTLRAAAMYDSDPVAILKALNEAINRSAAEGQFCTVAVVKICPKGDDLTGFTGLKAVVADGGHPLPFLIRAGGAIERIDARGIPLGMWPDADIGVVEVELEPGDKILLYTDGVLEARDEGELYGDDRLYDFLVAHGTDNAPDLAAALEHEAVEFQSHGVHDDIAILVVQASDEAEAPSISVLASEPRGSSSSPRVDIRLEIHARSVALARHSLESLSAHLSDEALASAELLISELVSNAVKYSFSGSGSYVGFAAEIEQGRLRVEVSDEGLGFAEPAADNAEPDAESGRGLFLVDALSNSWGVVQGERNVVWFEISLEDDL